MIKKYMVTLSTIAKVHVEVDANDTDEAIDMAIDLLDSEEPDFGEWEVEDVETDYES